MPNSSHEIRVCESCGLRYPLVEGHAFGTRCPACMGATRLVRRRQVTDEQRLAPGRQQNSEPRSGLAVLLDNVRSAWNVGSILRSADGFGFMQAFLCGITPPADNESVRKTSLGAEDTVPWSYHKDALKLVLGLKGQGWNIYGLEDDDRSLDIRAAVISTSEDPPGVLILGNEVSGIDPGVLELCDVIYAIPMRGQKRSYNVAMAFGIAAYAMTAGTPLPKKN